MTDLQELVSASGLSAEQTTRVLRVLEGYLAELEGGAPPHRDELLARHPDLAELLAEYLDKLDQLHEAAAGLRAAPDGAELPLAPLGEHGRLGDFDILREVGRGGMGVVYEAEQVSLGRRVALKVLPFAATLDPRQLQRFHNEARAAAGLHHTNIVPVHAVGCERGVHYYAMQFIEGHTLADFIAHQRGASPSQVLTVAEGEGVASATTVSPAAQATSAAPRDAAYFRRVAEWGIQAAEALDCAHTLGIVHRDVKPANLMVDAANRVWVTDFGLAQVQSDARLTMTGDLVGTLRYMSPEQALAKRTVIDHRTDVYSLGATLYELLTLRPAFSGTDRQELLRQIAFEEPLPPRRVNRAVPTELETVILKALEKNATERYATAKELADDLRCWLEDRPIRARRPSLAQRARKWSRRHRPLAIGLAVALAASAVLAVGAGLWHQWRQTQTERGVTAALAQADTLVAEGDKQTDQPERWQATALRALAAQEKAEDLLTMGVATEELTARVRQMRAAVDAAVADSEIQVKLDRIQLEQVSVDVVESRFDRSQAAPAYAEVLRSYGVDPAAPEAAAARVRDSRLREALLGALADWERVTRDEQERQQVARVLDLALPPDSLQARLRVATRRQDHTEVVKLAQELPIQDLPSIAIVNTAKDLVAVEEWTAAERLLRAGWARSPDDFWLNADLGKLLRDQRPPRPEEAVRYLTVAVALRPGNPGARINLAGVLAPRGDLEGAIIHLQAALHIVPDYFMAHNTLGLVLQEQGQMDEAIAEFREAARIKNDDPEAHYKLGAALLQKRRLDEAIYQLHEATRIKNDYWEAHFDLGSALREKGRLDEAIGEFHEALRLGPDTPEVHCQLGLALRHNGQPDQAIDEYREALRIDKDCAAAHINLGAVLCDEKGRLDEAIREFREAIRIKNDNFEARRNLGIALERKGQLDQAIDAYREATRVNKDHAEAHFRLGTLLKRKGQLDQAIDAYHRAIEIDKDYPEAHCNLGTALELQGQLDQAIDEYRKALQTKRGFPGAYFAHFKLGCAFQNQGRLDECIHEYSEAIRLKEDYPEAHCNLGHALHQKGEFREALEALRRGHELGTKKPGWSYPSAEWVRECERVVELDGKLLMAALPTHQAVVTSPVPFSR
jgi:tetratricopeptide (TPR) repeat protein/serine/threonine protein kinase